MSEEPESRILAAFLRRCPPKDELLTGIAEAAGVDRTRVAEFGGNEPEGAGSSIQVEIIEVPWGFQVQIVLYVSGDAAPELKKDPDLGTMLSKRFDQEALVEVDADTSGPEEYLDRAILVKPDGKRFYVPLLKQNAESFEIDEDSARWTAIDG